MSPMEQLGEGLTKINPSNLSRDSTKHHYLSKNDETLVYFVK